MVAVGYRWEAYRRHAAGWLQKTSCAWRNTYAIMFSVRQSVYTIHESDGRSGRWKGAGWNGVVRNCLVVFDGN